MRVQPMLIQCLSAFLLVASLGQAAPGNASTASRDGAHDHRDEFLNHSVFLKSDGSLWAMG